MKTRGASARQAAAQRRIQHIDTFSGSAPPFENMTDASDTPGWSMNPRKVDERRYLENMIRYLHDDPTVYDNLEILRFIYKEWPTMENTIHTKTTMDTLKRRLLSMNVRYIHRGKDPGNWAYWRDYTDDGMLEYHTAPADMTPMQYPVREDKEQSTPDIKALDRNPHVTSVSRDDDEGTLPSTPPVSLATNRETTKDALPDNVTPPPTQADPMTVTQILQTESTAEPPDNGTPHATTKTTEESLADDMIRMRPPDIMLDNVTLHHQFPPSTPLHQDNMQHTKHAKVLEPTTTVFNPYTGKRITVSAHPASSVDDMASSATLARNLLADLNDNDLVDMEDNTGTPDGFTPVLPRHGKRQQSNPARPRPRQPSPPLLVRSVRQTETTPAPSLHNVTNVQPMDGINPNSTLPGPSQPAMETFTDILHDRLQEAFLQMDRKEHQHMQAIEEHMADIAHRKEELLQREQQLATAQQRFNQRQHIYIARMNHWEGDVMSQEATVTRKRIELDTAMADFDQTISTATTRCNDLADQTKRSMRAWIEVTLEKLKPDLDIYKTAHKAHTEEFCTEQMSALESYLDSYSGHAAGIHANLLVRLRRDITRTYHDIQMANQDTNQHAAIPLDDDTVEDDEAMPTQQTGNVTATPGDTPTVTTPFLARRWKDVDYDTLQQLPPRQGPSTGPPTASVHPPSLHTATPRPFPAPPHSDVDQQISRLRKANTPTHLRGRDRKSVTVFYNSFVDFHKIYRVPFKILDDLRIDKLDDVTQERLHPADLLEDPTLYDRYSSAIYARLEEDGVLDPSDQLYQGLLQMYNSKRDGYRLLQDILATTLLVPSKNIGQLSTPPTVQQGTTPYDFACQLKEFYACQLQHNRTYTVREQATMFLQGMQHATPFTHAATQLLHDMHQIPDDIPLPLRLAFPNNLPLTLLTSAETMRSHTSTSATINVTRSTARTTDDRNPHDRDRSRERRPGYDRRSPRDSSMGRDSSAGRSARSTPQRPTSATTIPRPTVRNPDVQCAACATNGHTAMDCRQLPKIAACLEYITTHPTESNATVRQYRRTQHPEHRRMARDRIINVLQTRLQQGTLEDDEEGMEAIVDQLTGDYSDDDYLAPIFHLRAEAPQTLLPDSHWMANISLPMLTTEEIHRTIHPVTYPDISELSDPRAMHIDPTAEAITTHHFRQPILKDTVVQPLNVTRITPHLDTRRDLADTGASVSATGLLSILHQFTADTLYEIMGYDGAVTKAAGQGVALVYQATTGKMEPMLFVYVPTITGTIISLEHHARTHSAIHRWVQEATPSQNSGWVTFYNVHGATVSRYPTILDKGLYYIQDMTFIPTTTDTSGNTGSISMVTHHPAEETAPDDTTVRIANPSIPLDCMDYDPPLNMEHTQSMLRCLDTATIAICTDYIPPPLNHILLNRMSTSTILQPAADTVLGKMEKDVLNFEVWHQRFAHCSEKRLRQTQKHVDGIPRFHNATIPHIVACRACDVAKLRKAPRGPAATDLPNLEKGQVFHMDIGFIRGPANLPEVLARTQDAEPKVIESRQGYVCYLLIIDSKTRYGWPFPMKSKSVPPTLIRTFLTTHGNLTATHRRIRTDGEGSLAESTAFRSLVAELGYTLEKTATDSSSQNGIAERPHQTLATMVRCLLYASSLPTPFWADALVYASYINNRLYNSGIDAVPYTQWTGRRANVKHLRVFGAHVSVKRSGNRPTMTDPHYYNGRFLRFGATERNIIYYDPVTKRDKTARHCKLDEFHYGSLPSDRPHGAQHLLSQVLPHCKSPTSSMDTNDDTPMDEFVPQSDIPLPIDAMHETLDAQPTTAVAAQLLADQQHQAILHLDTSPDMYGQPITLTIPINRLPTLGFIMHMDTNTGQLFVKGCQDGTFCSRIPRWRSTIRNSVVRSINSTRVRSRTHMVQLIQESRSQGHAHVTFIFAKIAVRTNDDDDIPQLHFDQLRHLNQLHIALRAPANEVNDVFLNYTRAQLRKRPDYDEWRQSEWQQHNKFALQNMFGKPIPRPEHAIVLPFVWNYSIKEDPITGAPKRKARGTCNGGKRYGKAVTVAETYATCVEQPACRLYWAVTASEGLLAMGADAGNAFAEAPPPDEPFFMKIDDQYMEWWVEHLGNEAIPPGYVLPVNHALQGHPEASRLWETHIHGIIVDKLHFTPTTHEKCLYSKRDQDGDNLQMILRQVDDFSVSADSQDQCQQTIATIGSYLQVPLNDLGIIRKFNGVNVLQTRWYIKISCEDYILKILMHHNWQDLKASNLPIPMRHDSKYQRELELAIRPESPHDQQQVQNQAGFSYRMTIGELIYALVVARVDISFAIIKLSQYSASPASIHYQAVRNVFAFLNNTREDGLIFWRKTPRNDLPLSDIPTPRSNPQDRLPTPITTPTRLLAYSDSDWGSDASHRRSVTGTIVLLSGAAVLYSTKYQKAVALSSTEAEFVAASDTGKTAIYMRTILSDLGFSQDNPTQLLIDNTGAVFMIDVQAPTKRTRHVDIRYFALLQWSNSGQVKAEAIPTDANISDSLTKATGRIKFHQHADIYMGRSPPSYVHHHAELSLSSTCRLHTFSALPVTLETFSALHHHIISSYVVHPSDYTNATEHGRVRGYSPRSTVATS